MGGATHAVVRNDEWKSRFYAPSGQSSLFGEPAALERHVNIDALGDYFLERLGSVFTAVAKHTLTLRNSRGSPLFLLCFAAGNPVGAKTAVKIADDILKK